MIINLTFIFQLLNIMLTILVLRQIFWPQLLNVIEVENDIIKQSINACEVLKIAIQEIEQNQKNNVIKLASTAHKALEELKEDEERAILTPEILEKTPQKQKERCPINKAVIDRITSLIQKDF